MEDLSARNGAKGERCYVIWTRQLGYQATIDSTPCESGDDGGQELHASPHIEHTPILSYPYISIYGYVLSIYGYAG